MADPPVYDEIGVGYTRVRAEDPRLARRIRAALGDARTVLNVGAGAGAYEPPDLEVTAVEPSAVMRAQRPPGVAPAIDARVEALPFAAGAFDAAMAVLSDHHWEDRDRGLDELRRVARRRVVLFCWDPATVREGWIVRDYFPAFEGLERTDIEVARTAERLAGPDGTARVDPVPIPHDCRDGFFHAYWRRPQAYLDPVVRAGISIFSRLPPDDLERGLARLRDDLGSGRWRERHADLLERDELDLGYRIVVAELGGGRAEAPPPSASGS